MTAPKKVRISAAVIGHLEGGDAWQSGQACVDSGYERQSTVDMTEAIKAAPRRKDGSVTVDLTAEQRDALYEMADVMAIGAKDNIEPPKYRRARGTGLGPGRLQRRPRVDAPAGQDRAGDCALIL